MPAAGALSDAVYGHPSLMDRGEGVPAEIGAEEAREPRQIHPMCESLISVAMIRSHPRSRTRGGTTDVTEFPEHPDVLAAEWFGVPASWPGNAEPDLSPKCPTCVPKRALVRGGCPGCGYNMPAEVETPFGNVPSGYFKT